MSRDRIEEIIKQAVESYLTATRSILKVQRLVPDNGDGVTERYAKVSGLHDGVLKTFEEQQKKVLSCGHAAPIAILCQFRDDQIASDHYACSACSFVCAGCQRAGCAQHLEIINDKRFCAACSRVVRLDALGQGIFSGLLGFFK